MRNPMQKSLQTVLVFGLFCTTAFLSSCKSSAEVAAAPAAAPAATSAATPAVAPAAIAPAPVTPAKAVPPAPAAPAAPAKPVPSKESVDSAAKIGGESASSDLVYVITLHGTVGIIPGESAKAFTAEGLKVSLDAAKRANATVVVLDIDGPGGQMLEMQNMVKLLLEAQVGGMRIVALPRDAFSAWAIVALSCKEILVTPTSRMGAAVSVKNNGNGFIEAVEGKDAVSQKFAAPFQALWRQITDVTGRPPCIANAMQIQTAELWYSPTKGFAEKSGTESDWQQLDDGVHVLCLTGNEMLKTKMAIGELRTQSDLPKLLNCDFGTHIENYVFQESLDSLGSNIHGSAASIPMSDMMYVVMKTNKGDVVMELDNKMAPKSVENFMSYVNENYYDGTIFHRVISGFMIQGGGFTSDMKQKSTKAPIVNEGKNGLLNSRGTLAMARTNDPNSATSQFFINTVDNQFLNASGRNPGYAVFGKVIDGMDVVDVIRAMPTKRGDVPVETVEIISIRPLPGPPAAKK